MTDKALIQRLKQLIGKSYRYGDKNVVVFDIVADAQIAVLKPLSGNARIQRDMLGNASHIGEQFVEIPLFGEDDAFSDELMYLLENPLTHG